MTSCRTETEIVRRLLLQPSVSGVVVSLFVSALTVDILSTFCDRFVVQCVQLMLRTFLHLLFLLFDCFVCTDTFAAESSNNSKEKFEN